MWANFQAANWHTLQDKNYFLVLGFWSSDIGRTESDAYEPTVHMHRCAKKNAYTLKTPCVVSVQSYSSRSFFLDISINAIINDLQEPFD